jgi:hypothetical protein
MEERPWPLTHVNCVRCCSYRLKDLSKALKMFDLHQDSASAIMKLFFQSAACLTSAKFHVEERKRASPAKWARALRGVASRSPD